MRILFFFFFLFSSLFAETYIGCKPEKRLHETQRPWRSLSEMWPNKNPYPLTIAHPEHHYAINEKISDRVPVIESNGTVWNKRFTIATRENASTFIQNIICGIENEKDRYSWTETIEFICDITFCKVEDTTMVQDTICVNTPASFPFKGHYFITYQGLAVQTLNSSNLCPTSPSGRKEYTIYTDGETGQEQILCPNTCESRGIPNGGNTTCSAGGCNASTDQSGAINPNLMGTSGGIGGGSGGGFGSGAGGSGAGGGGGDFFPDSLSDTSKVTPPDWENTTCNPWDCFCDGWTFIGLTSRGASIYNASTGASGLCPIPMFVEPPAHIVSQCRVDWQNCKFSKTDKDSTVYQEPDTLLTSQDTVYMQSLDDINATLKAIDFNQNNNFTNLKEFMEYNTFNVDFTDLQNTLESLELSADVNVDIPQFEFPDSIYYDYDTESMQDLETFYSESYTLDSLELSEKFNRYADSASYAVEAGFIDSLNLGQFQELTDTLQNLVNPFLSVLPSGNNSSCPSVFSTPKNLELYGGQQVSLDISFICTPKLAGMNVIELSRIILRFIVSIGCFFMILKAVNLIKSE